MAQDSYDLYLVNIKHYLLVKKLREELYKVLPSSGNDERILKSGESPLGNYLSKTGEIFAAI